MIRWTVLVVSLCVASGCSRESPNRVKPAGSETQARLESVYAMFQEFSEKRGRRPKDLNELNEYGRSRPALEGGAAELSVEYLTSPRDRQPIVLRFAAPEKNGRGILAHEAEGEQNKKYVLFFNGTIRAIDDAELEQNK